MRVTEEGEDAPGQQLPVAAVVQEERISSIRFHQSSRISDVHCSSSSRIRDPSLDEDGAAGIQAASNPVRRKERERIWVASVARTAAYIIHQSPRRGREREKERGRREEGSKRCEGRLQDKATKTIKR